jgi:ribosomal protein S18 acetylase RimI-like enzyme
MRMGLLLSLVIFGKRIPDSARRDLISIKPIQGRRRAGGAGPIRVRAARAADLAQVIEIDAGITRLRKPAYWRSIYRRYGAGRRGSRFFVAETGGRIEGYIVGEVRDWEFGSPPCGWVFGVGVRPQARLAGIGTRMLEAICEVFRDAGVGAVRTLIARDNHLVHAFFRSQGMMAAPVVALEMAIGRAGRA